MIYIDIHIAKYCKYNIQIYSTLYLYVCSYCILHIYILMPMNIMTIVIIMTIILIVKIILITQIIIYVYIYIIEIHTYICICICIHICPIMIPSEEHLFGMGAPPTTWSQWCPQAPPVDGPSLREALLGFAALTHQILGSLAKYRRHLDANLGGAGF